MSGHILDTHRRSLEEAFFAEQERLLRDKMREGAAALDTRQALTAATGIEDTAVLDRLLGLGITPQAAAALTLLPMAVVAWADGGVSEGERGAVIEAAERAGVLPGSPGFAILEAWLKTPPPASLIEAWKHYAKALAAPLGTMERSKLADDALGRARAVADAEGGFFGLGRRISAAEQAALDDLHKAFEGV
jgi:hypothetical protein